MVQRVQVRYINRTLRHGEGVQSDPRCQKRHPGAKEERCAYPWRQRTCPAEETALEISGMLRISRCQEFYGGCARLAHKVSEAAHLGPGVCHEETPTVQSLRTKFGTPIVELLECSPLMRT